jgi:hypothetical protein
MPFFGSKVAKMIENGLKKAQKRAFAVTEELICNFFKLLIHK